MSRHWNLIFMLAVTAAQPVAAQSPATAGDTAALRAHYRHLAAQDLRTAWLRDHAVRIRTIDPASDDFADLEPLAAAIGTARIVMLGEQTHGEGSTMLGKARLVRFLHERMGFDVLAFETPMYDAIRAWRAIEAGTDADSAFRRGVFGTWTRAEQFQPLIRYVAQQSNAADPLVIAGFDSQSYLPYSRDSLAIELRAVLARLVLAPERLDPDRPLGRQIAHLVSRKPVAGWLPDSLDVLGAQVDSAAARHQVADSIAFMRQVLFSLPHFARQARVGVEADSAQSALGRAALWAAGSAARDKQMALNLVWLARQYYAGEKIIVWAASGHTKYGDPALQDPMRWWDEHLLVNSRPMGQWVRQAMGDSVYSILFTSYDGVARNPTWPRAYPLEVHTSYNQREDVDFEDLMTAAGFAFGYVDLRGARAAETWLGRPFVARPISNVSMKARWADLADGLFFIRTATPVAALSDVLSVATCVPDRHAFGAFMRVRSCPSRVTP